MGNELVHGYIARQTAINSIACDFITAVQCDMFGGCAGGSNCQVGSFEMASRDCQYCDGMYFEGKLLQGEAVIWNIGCIVKVFKHYGKEGN